MPASLLRTSPLPCFLCRAVVVLSTQGTPETGTAPLDLFNNLFDANQDGLKTYLELGSYRNFAAEE